MPADKAGIKATLEVVTAAPAAPQFRLICILEERVFERPAAATYGRRKGRLSGRRHGGCARHGDAPRRRAGTPPSRPLRPARATRSCPCMSSIGSVRWIRRGTCMGDDRLHCRRGREGRHGRPKGTLGTLFTGN